MFPAVQTLGAIKTEKTERPTKASRLFTPPLPAGKGQGTLRIVVMQRLWICPVVFFPNAISALRDAMLNLAQRADIIHLNDATTNRHTCVPQGGESAGQRFWREAQLACQKTFLEWQA